MLKKIALFAVFLVVSGHVYAVDLTKLVCSQPQMQESELTKECKGNAIATNTICQGNEGKAWCKGASLDVGDTSLLRVSIGFRNRHVPGKIWNPFKGKHDPIVLYDSKSTGTVTVWIDNACNVIDKDVEFTNATAQLLQWLGDKFGKRVEDSIPNQVPGC